MAVEDGAVRAAAQVDVDLGGAGAVSYTHLLAGALALLLIARLLVEKSAIAGMALMLLSFAALFLGLYLDVYKRQE